MSTSTPFALFAPLAADRRGGVALWAASAMPLLVMLAIGGAEMARGVGDRGRLQAVADAAALAGALELGVARPDDVADGAEAFALAQAESVRGIAALTAEATVVDEGGGLELVMTSQRPSLLGALGAGGWRTRVRAVARTMNRTPRCVIGLNRKGAGTVVLRDQARVTASGCAVHSNKDLTVAAGGNLTAAVVQAAGAATGPISPAAQVGTEPVDDPFAGRDIAIPFCPLLPGLVQLLDLRSGTRTLPRGVHCGDVFIRETATLNLAPGEHYFLGDLIVADTARLNGADVALFFGQGAKLTFQGRATVDLTGRRSGKHAGLLIVSGRENSEDFRISSDNVRRLEGVVYMPASRLLVSGTGKVASQSEWTVTVTKSLQVQGSPTLVINDDYAGSGVPVPNDLGPGVGAVRLSE